MSRAAERIDDALRELRRARAEGRPEDQAIALLRRAVELARRKEPDAS